MRSKITKKQDFETHHKHFRILGSGQNFPRPMFLQGTNLSPLFWVVGIQGVMQN